MGSILRAVVGVHVFIILDDTLILGVFEALRVNAREADTVLEAETELVPEEVRVATTVPVIVFVSTAVIVRLIEPVLLTETVDVLLCDADLVPVRVITIERDGPTDDVVVLELLTVTVRVGLALFVLEDPVDFVPLGEAVPVLEDVDVLVLVLVITDEPDSLADFENEADADDVFELALLTVEEPHEDAVLLMGADLLSVGDELAVLDIDDEAVFVFVAPVVFVPVAVPVLVFVIKFVTDAPGELEDDLELLEVLVIVIVEVCVLVLVGDGVTSRVAAAERVNVVVFVDVLELVVVDVGITANSRIIGSIL